MNDLTPLNHPPPPVEFQPYPQLAYIDSSMLSTFRSCKRKFYWNYIQQLRPAGESIHLIAGGAFAAGCEAARIRQFRDSPDRQLPIDDLLLAAIPAFAKAWGTYEASEDDAKNYHNTFHALEHYLTEYPPFTDPVQPIIKADGSPTTEFTFAIPLPVRNPAGDPYCFVGRFDLLGKYHDLVVVQDEKTTSALGPYWLRQWDMRGQFIGYVWACRQLGYPVDHVVVRGIAIQKTQHQLVSVPVAYSNIQVDRWYEELLNSLHELNHCYANEFWSYNFGDACSSYGGCGYVDLCKAADPSLFLTNFQRHVWNPVTADASG